MDSIFQTFAVLKPDLTVDEIPFSPSFYQELDETYDQFRSHVLISAHQFSEDWNVWEQHPEGDELVVLIGGKAA